jgi:multicomponent Na+:H+ antiporter subunit E
MKYLNWLLRLTIWFLLTADGSLINIIIGICVAVLLPQTYTEPSVLKDWLKLLWKVIVAIPKAYIEAFELILFPHRHEDVSMKRAKPNRTPGLVFLDIFLITFTPKTIVLKYHKTGWYEVHWIRRRSRS